MTGAGMTQGPASPPCPAPRAAAAPHRGPGPTAAPHLPTARDLLAELAERCRPCFQCGRCRSACPQGLDLAAGPRSLVRLVLAGDLTRLLASEDVWRCSECGACTLACPTGVDVAGTLAGVRRLQLAEGGPRCPERGAAEIAGRRLRRGRRLDGLTLGLGLARRGFLPRNPARSAGLALRMLRDRLRRRDRLDPRHPDERRLDRRHSEPAPAPRSPAGVQAFFPGCALLLDRRALAATQAAAAGVGIALASPDGFPCCGHPARDPALPAPRLPGPLLTACPACERTLSAAGTPAAQLWRSVVDRARRGEGRLQAGGARLVPYVGCLADRDATLAVMTEAAELGGAQALLARPSLHSGCCGGLGGLYREPTRAVTELLRFAAERGAPVVTPCLLCRDTVRAAAANRGLRLPVHFWPEFFQVVPAPSPPSAAAPGREPAASPRSGTETAHRGLTR